MKKVIAVLFLLSTLHVVSQSIISVTNYIVEDYEYYFKTDRKSVHIHLNKNSFITGEHIWFSTYVFNHTKNLPSKEDEYVFIDLINDTGDVLDSKAVLFKNGFGKGDLFVDESFKTGKYFLQVYTSNMQDFEEDESTVYPIQIRNLESNKISVPQYHTNRDSLIITIAAESGNLVEELFSSVAVRTTNAFGYGYQPDSLYLIDETNAKLSKIKIDENGLGTFSLLPKKGKKYALLAYHTNRKFQKNIPLQTSFGHTITVDRNHQKEHFIITINSKSFREQELTLVIHKDGNAIKIPKIKNNISENAIVLSYYAVYPGVNTISLLTTTGQTLAERLLYNRPITSTPKIQLKKTTSNKDSIEIAFHRPKIFENASVSASILPGSSSTSDFTKKAFYSIHLEPYLDLEDWQNLAGITCRSMEELYYLDKVLLLAKSKYKWNTILSSELLVPNPQVLPATLEGYVNAFKDRSESLQVLLYSKENELLLSTSADSENKFAFENIILAKGSKINLTLSSSNGKPIYANFFYTIKPNIASFRHHYQPKQFNLKNPIIIEPEVSEPLLKEIQQLKEVTVTANKLKYQKFFKSYFGVKVDSTIGMTTLKDFIFQQGYYPMFIDEKYADPRRAGSIQIGKSTPRSGALTQRCRYVFPSIIINGKYDEYIDSYENLRMEFIDEIYFDRPSSCAANFVVFTNEKYKNRPLTESEKTSKEFIVDIGYDVPNSFERPKYYNITEDAFERFGILSWNPSIIADEKKPIIIMAPLDNQSSVKIILEGMTTTGELISQDFHVNLNQ
ncbi:MAG: hypothetical protein AB8B59_08500 [Maribacter sp.]